MTRLSRAVHGGMPGAAPKATRITAETGTGHAAFPSSGARREVE